MLRMSTITRPWALLAYGDSGKPPDGDNHINYSKHAMAVDQLEHASLPEGVPAGKASRAQWPKIGAAFVLSRSHELPICDDTKNEDHLRRAKPN